MKIVKILLSFLAVLSFCITTAYSIKLPFLLERLNTDYNGIVFNANIVLAYGKYGVITYSTDQGESWKQISFGNKLDILKIFVIGSDFYALTPYSVLKSKDGINWKQKILFDEPLLTDFTFDETFLYLSTKNEIYRLDHNLMDEPELFFEFDEFTSISEIVYLQNHLFIIDGNYYILKLNLDNKEIDTIDVHNFLSSDVRDISHLKVYNSTIYVLAESIFQNDPKLTQLELVDSKIRHTLINSNDLGLTWNTVTSNIRLTKEYQVFDGVVHFLTQKAIRDSITKKYYYSIRYFKINNDKKEEEINTNDFFDRRIPAYEGGYTDLKVPNTFRVNMFVRISSDKIIAVGPNKTIFISTNNGNNWELISYFKPITGLSPQVKFFGNDTILVVCSNRPYYFMSVDGGTTFLPPKFDVKNYPESGFDESLILSDASIALIEKQNFTHTEEINDSTTVLIFDSTYFYFYLSKDFGETFEKRVFYRSHIFTSDSIIYSTGGLFPLKDTLVVLFTWWRNPMNPSTTNFNDYIYLFDKSFNLIDSIKQDTNFRFLGSNLFVEDTAIYFLQGNSLYRTKNFGKSWDTLFSGFSNSNSLKLHYKDYFLIQNTRWKETGGYEDKLLLLNLKNMSLDSISYLPSPLDYFFVYKDTIFAYYRTNNHLYFFPNGLENMKNYDSVDVGEMLNDLQVIIKSVVDDGQDYYFLGFKESGSGIINPVYELNIAKVVYSEPKYLPVEPNIEKGWVYLYNFPPFPMPAKDYIRSRLHWELPYTPDDIKVAVYDVYGNKQLGAKVEIEQILPYSGWLKVDLSNLANGIYTAVVRLSSRTLSIPFIIAK